MDTSRGYLLALPRRVAAPARRRLTSTCGRCTSGPTPPRSRRRCRRSTSRSSSGRAAYVGVSNWSGWRTAQGAAWQRAVPGRAPLVSTQMEYSLLNRGIEHEVVPAARELGLGILPWSPLGRGVLTGKYRTGTPGRLARRLRDVAVRGRLPRRVLVVRRGGGRQGRRGAGLDAARGGAGLGPRPPRRDRADRRRPDLRAAASRPSPSRTARCPDELVDALDDASQERR